MDDNFRLGVIVIEGLVLAAIIVWFVIQGLKSRKDC